MSDTVTAREFLLNTFNTDFLTGEEKETIIRAMELFAFGKCKEQREICYDAWAGMPEYEDDKLEELVERGKRTIENANHPFFETI